MQHNDRMKLLAPNLRDELRTLRRRNRRRAAQVVEERCTITNSIPNLSTETRRALQKEAQRIRYCALCQSHEHDWRRCPHKEHFDVHPAT